MTVKSIVDVEIRDEKFKSFLTLFNEYKAQLDQLPAAWNKTAKATESASEHAGAMKEEVEATSDLSEKIVESFAEMTASLMAQAEQHRLIAQQDAEAAAAAKKERDAQAKADKERDRVRGRRSVHAVRAG